MPCPDCGNPIAAGHKSDCLSVRVARGEITLREAQVRRLQSAVPCPVCGRGSPLGTHDCEATPACAVDDGSVDHIYVEGYDRCIECGKASPEVRIGKDYGGAVGSEPPADNPYASFGELMRKGTLVAPESWSGEFMKNAEEMHKKLGVSAEKATEAMQHMGQLCGIPVGASPHVPEGSIYVIDGNSGQATARDPEHWIGSASRAQDDIENFRLAGHDPESIFLGPRTWQRFRDGVVHLDGRAVGRITNIT